MKVGDLASLSVPPDTPPMEARIVEVLPSGGGWQFEPKWDGFRCLAFRAAGQVELKAKSGKSLARYFPEVVDALLALKSKSFVVDGELVVPLGNTLSFGARQLRRHPAASRTRRLAGETPALFILFDCLMTDSAGSLLAASLEERRAALEAMFSSWGEPATPRLPPFTRQRRQAQRWLRQSRGGLDGVVAKRLDEPYQPGERAMVKVKLLRTVDCVVGGFRYGSGRWDRCCSASTTVTASCIMSGSRQAYRIANVRL